jgi:hypothetical protein
MFWWTLKIACISFLFIALIHHLFCYFKQKIAKPSESKTLFYNIHKKTN